jgi:hypothetical protein
MPLTIRSLGGPMVVTTKPFAILAGTRPKPDEKSKSDESLRMESNRAW